MSRKLPHTPVSQIKGAVRQLTLRCRERQAALKAADRRCSVCGAKHSRAKGREVTVEAHHRRPPNWQRVVEVIREELLQTPGDWQALCTACHDAVHEYPSLAQKGPCGGETGGAQGVGRAGACKGACGPVERHRTLTGGRRR